MSKPRILIYDIGGCEGCPVSLIRVLPQLNNIAIVHFRYTGSTDLDMEYDYAIVTGSICHNSSEHVEVLKKIREISKIVIAYGSCACVGGVMLYARGGQKPKPDHRIHSAITKVVKVDYGVPGCPPAPQMLISLLNSIKVGKGYFLDLFRAVAYNPKLSGFDLLDEVVLMGLCVGCGACILSCPTNALQMIDNKPDLIPEKCIRCGTCTVRCPRFTQILIRRAKLMEKTQLMSSIGG